MASRYRKIDPRIWNDEKFRDLTDDGKLVFLFLLTHPHMTALGAMRGTLPGLAAELGWTVKRFTAAAQKSIASEIVEACENASWIGIPNFIRYNEPEGPNSVTKAWITALDLLPECQQKRRLIQRCRIYLQARSENFRDAMGDAIWDAFPDAIPDAKRDPSTIQEQEQEQEQESPLPPKGRAAALNGLQPEGIFQKWNTLPGVKPCKALDATLRDRIRTRLAEHPDPAWWDGFFQQVTAADFLCGRTNGTRGAFHVTLDWVLGPKNLGKVLRGNYDTVKSASKERLPL